MAHWMVNIIGKGIRKATVEKLANSLKDQYGEGTSVSISVNDSTPPESRSDRFAEALGQLEAAKETIDALKEELEEWKSSIPENLQGGDKYNELEESTSALEELSDNIQNSIDTEVNFPSMM